jgi:peroxiredoxin
VTRRIFFLLVLLGTALTAVPTHAQSPTTATGDVVELEPGDLAPDFTLPGSDGKTYRLSEFRGVRPVVLAWFPKANATL